MSKKDSEPTGLEIAIIGMAGKFPGAGNLDEYWDMLVKGIESVSFFSREELVDTVIDPEELNHPNYIAAKGVLDDLEYFDTYFFGYTPRESEIMTPQLRIFHEVAWTALEDAGYNPDTYNGLIGVFAGGAQELYWELLIYLSGKYKEFGLFEAALLTSKDPLGTRLSYKLNLTGPSFTLYTACSTSGTAIHEACQALLGGECHMALAGAVSIWLPQKSGYVYQPEVITSPDGHCRPFDAAACGTVFGDGVGVVILKLLEDALKDGDHIYAVIKGTALNNDGRRKVGYTAPSTEGQSEVMRTALHTAGIEVESISYIEAHGTATSLGDVIEANAVKLAYKTDKKGSCGIGSVKSNIGHLNSAGGMAGLIKTVLALKNRLIPPTLHFNGLNPQILFDDSPFYVVNELMEWKSDGYPLRAGVSIFGLGGTNFHAILEEAPGTNTARKDYDTTARGYQLILWSAKTQPALERIKENLTGHFKENPHINLANAAYTLQTGRKSFNHRQMLVCSGVEDALDALSADGKDSPAHRGKVFTSVTEDINRPVIFMFPGQGSQYVNMGRDLYEKEPVFREEMNRCFRLLTSILDYDIKKILYPSQDESIQSLSQKINQTQLAQPVLFIIEYALAKLLMKWGIKPHTMIGHSIGEYTAACLSGVFSLEDALTIVALRGKLIQPIPGGAMVSVPLPEEKILPSLNNELALAAVNTTSQCVVSGPRQEINAFVKELNEKDCQAKLLHTSHAFHSSMMEPVLKEFAQAAGKITFNKPKIPFISNLTGKQLSAEEAANPHYWARHILCTVRFAEGLTQLLKESDAIFLEVGPGRTLSSFVNQHKNKKNGHLISNLIRHPHEDITDHFYLLNKIGQCWLQGLDIDWKGFYSGEKRRRISLPTYPFERIQFPQIKALDLREKFLGKLSLSESKDIEDFYYFPTWKHIPLIFHQSLEDMPDNTCWVLFSDNWGLGGQLVKKLEKHKQRVIVVKVGETFERINEYQYTLNPHLDKQNDYEALFSDLQKKRLIPTRIVHLWQITPLKDDPLVWENINQLLNLGYYSLIQIARAAGKYCSQDNILLSVITNNMYKVLGDDSLSPGKIAGLGPVKVIPSEYSNIKCNCMDIVLPAPDSSQLENLREQLFEELISGEVGLVAAFRSNQRWVQSYEPLRLEKSSSGVRFKKEGVYLVTGGLGGVGMKLAEYIAQKISSPRLILIGRSEFPPRDKWGTYLSGEANDKDPRLAQKIRAVQELEKSGARVLVFRADVSVEEQIQPVIDKVIAEFGAINGVIHAAGLPDGEMIQKRERKSSEVLFASKIKGTLILDRLLKRIQPDFFVLCSSLGSIVGVIGQVGYFAANAFLDAFAHYKNGLADTFTVSINWDRWQNLGIATILEDLHKEMTGEELGGGFSGEEGQEAFGRIMEIKLPQVAVTKYDLMSTIEQSLQFELLDLAENFEESAAGKKQLYKRPHLNTEYVEPRNENEQKLADIWSSLFSIEKVGIHDDFFELGGDSLKAINLVSRICRKFEIKMETADVFNHPTIEEQAIIIHSAKRDKYDILVPVEKKEYYPLSPSQKRLYVIQQLEPASTAYNIFTLIPLVDIDKEILERVLQNLLERHESIRTSIQMIQGELVQVIHDQVPFSLEYVEEGSIKAQDVIKNFVKPFDLSKAPFFRIGLIKRAEQYLLIIDTHHIIVDHFSHSIVLEEFITLYSHRSLPALKLQYKDYAEWLLSDEKKADLRKQKEYWLKEFTGEFPVLNLPTDFPRPEIQSFVGSSVGISVDREDIQKLKALALEQGGTLFTIILAILYILLWKLSGDEDIVIGVPVLARRHLELERIIGMFANILALRNYPQGEKSFREFLSEVNERLMIALENQEYSFDELVKEVLAHRDPGRNPLYDVIFVHNPWIDVQVGDILKISSPGDEPGNSYNTGVMESQNDITLELTEYDDRCIYTMAYCTKLFKAETINRFLNYLHEIQSIIIENKDIKLKDINISYQLMNSEPDILKEELEDFGF
ncbi:MAG: SDR family NAD(P)-dependent oxidoreductase [Candidatus Aminicenantes bacterium]|jgi:acyl transferase domain-containing protein/NAD(P)-dependent dehydrogenase (short-subunit alcohol dehydrogenase family)/acyl carrier protein